MIDGKIMKEFDAGPQSHDYYVLAVCRNDGLLVTDGQTGQNSVGFRGIVC